MVLAAAVVLVVGAGFVVFGRGIDRTAKSVKLTYEVTGTAKNVTIGYSTITNGNSGTHTEQNVSLPWTKEVVVEGSARGATLTVSAGAEGGRVTCGVRSEDGEPRTASAEGPFAVASCTSP
nr:hypothetical protein GCM10020241_51020 [Streptoalloteichus tenebrarius]